MLLKSSFLFNEGVAPLILQLLSYAICGAKTQAAGSSSPQKGKKDKEKDREKDKENSKDKDKEKNKGKEKVKEAFAGQLF